MDLTMIAAIVGGVWLLVVFWALALCRASARADCAADAEHLALSEDPQRAAAQLRRVLSA